MYLKIKVEVKYVCCIFPIFQIMTQNIYFIVRIMSVLQLCYLLKFYLHYVSFISQQGNGNSEGISISFILSSVSQFLKILCILNQPYYETVWVYF